MTHNRNRHPARILLWLLAAVFLLPVVLGIFLVFVFFWCFPSGQVSSEEGQAWQFLFGSCGFFGATSLLTSFVFSKMKRHFNVSYDYVFVSGELRISKVFNVNRRKLVARVDCEDMIQVGDVDNSSYERFKADPTVKQLICTPNVEASDGKFFMYVLANYNGKKLFVLECRENLLMNIMKFAKRSVLESDYVMQERKQK